jgi:hypothetical protein
MRGRQLFACFFTLSPESRILNPLQLATSEIESDKQAYETCVGTSRSRQNGRWRN